MKPDGANMETPEPGETAAVAERSSQENITEEAQPQPEAEAVATQKANGKPVAVEPKVKPKGAGSNTQSTSAAPVAGSRSGAASQRTEKYAKPSSAGPAGKKAAGTTLKTSAAGAVPKRPAAASATASATAKNQTRALDKRPVGPGKTTSLPNATVANGTKPRAANGTAKKPAAEAANGARPKTTTATNRPVTSAVPKPNTSTVTKPAAPASSKTRPATGPSTSRPTSTLSKPAAATAKVSTTATAKVAPSRTAAASSAGRSTAAQPNKNAKKDVSRPPAGAAAPVPKKPFTASGSPVAKKKEPSKSTTVAKPSSTATKAADPKASQAKAQQPAKPNPTKKPAVTAHFPPLCRPPLGRTPPASPAGKPKACIPGTPVAKRGTKPTQTVSPFHKKTQSQARPVATPQSSGASLTAAEPVQVAEAVTEATAAEPVRVSEAVTEATAAEPVRVPEAVSEAMVALESAAAASAVEEVAAGDSAQFEGPVEPEEDTRRGKAAAPPSQSPVRTTAAPTSPFTKQSENCAASPSLEPGVSSPGKPSSQTVADSSDHLQEAKYLSTGQIPPAPAAHSTEATCVPLTTSLVNLSDEDEEEREGSQLVSVSEMSGTTQPTEESRPGSGGPVSGAAWKAGSALLSEFDSEDVSGSQQGASELSAPGVLEGTESTDDLGDGSLKGAIDMEGASAGSPDFEKVPEIPANEFEDEDEDDSDRVCDMDVGSERMDEPSRPRHDNDVDEDEDDDVEMASEGVTESGLESYGNADEDDFAEDERLDNLNRVLQPPPPPPVLPSAPAAQWDQPNPFACPWAEPPQSNKSHIPQLLEDASTSAQMEGGHQKIQSQHVATPESGFELNSQSQQVRDLPHHVEPQGPANAAAPLMSTSSTARNEMSEPEDQGDQNREGKQQPEQDCQETNAVMEKGEEEEEEEDEAEPVTLPADEVLGGPSTAPTSNPSSSSVTEDEASDTEGEAQLDDTLECPAVRNLTFEAQPSPQRCLSTVEEGEEAESGAGDEATPPSATSVASYIFDSVTTASNSNAQSTGESCIKSPGIFSLEELPEEAKESVSQQCLNQDAPECLNQDAPECLNQDAPECLNQDVLQCPAEQPYIECGKQEPEAIEHLELELPGSNDALAKPEEITEDVQPPYYSICEKTEDSFAGNV